MSCCSQCGGSSGCSCHNVGCFGQILYLLGNYIMIMISVGILVFAAPGMLYHYAAGTHTDTSRDFIEFAIDDKRTWVFSAVVWIALGLWQFHRFTRVEPPAKSEAD